MTPNQKINKTRDELNAMADRCRAMAEDLEAMADGLPDMPYADIVDTVSPICGFEAVRLMQENGQRIAIGQLITTCLRDGRTVQWRVIDAGGQSKHDAGPGPVVAQMTKVLVYRQFSVPNKKYVFGINDYGKSDIGTWLESRFARLLLRSDDFDCTVGRIDIDGELRHVWLLSYDEAGFGDAKKAYAYYSGEERESRRIAQDADGEQSRWWLRTGTQDGLGVQCVTKEGNIEACFANSANGVLPAVIIG